MSSTRSREPLVDIGMPAYRRPDFIAEAIESVLAQTHANWRLVVSENGPGGGEVERAVRRFEADPRVRYEATGENLGPAANWTRLIQAGDSDYFTLIQDDDAWDPTFLARRVAFLTEHPSCGFVFSGERKMDGDGREISVERSRSLPAKDVSSILEEGVYSPRHFFSLVYRHSIGGIHTPSIASVGVMSQRSALNAVGPRFQLDFPFLFWDVELYVRMALRYPTGFLAVRDVRQRLHHPSMTSEAEFDGEYWVRYLEYYGAWIQRELPDLRLPRQYDELRSRAYLMSALDAVQAGDRRRGLRRLGDAVRAYPRIAANPRVPAAAAASVLGPRGTRALAGVRGAVQRRSERLAYESSDV